MRICTEKKLCSPSDAWQFVGFVEVFLDGERLWGCDLADEEHGYAIVRNCDHSMESTALRGQVELRLRDPDSLPGDVVQAWNKMRDGDGPDLA